MKYDPQSFAARASDAWAILTGTKTARKIPAPRRATKRAAPVLALPAPDAPTPAPTSLPAVTKTEWQAPPFKRITIARCRSATFQPIYWTFADGKTIRAPLESRGKTVRDWGRSARMAVRFYRARHGGAVPAFTGSSWTTDMALPDIGKANDHTAELRAA